MPTSDKKSSGWFHCGHCGELFRARMGEVELRACDVCGREPSHDQWEVGATFASAALPVPQMGFDEPALADPPHPRRKRKKNTLAIVVLLWVVFLGLLVLLARWFWRPPEESERVGALGPNRSAISYLDEKLLNDHMPVVSKTFAAHVVAANDAQRAQTVLDPIRVAPRLAKFFEMNPLIRIDLENLMPKSVKVLRLPEGEVIEVLWKGGDRMYDSAFIRRNDEWKLDWEHFARYSDFPLSLFLAGSGPDEAEFRLFARERLAAEKKSDPDMSVVLYSAVAGRPRDAGVQTPAFLVPRDSPVGKRLTAGFQQAREGRRPFDSQLEVEKPEDLIRVRVKILRKELEGLRVFEITEVKACHWYGLTDAPGVPE